MISFNDDIDINNNYINNETKKDKQKIIINRIPFIEKYRPIKFEDLILPDDIISKLINITQSNIIPNILISGPSGTGKTSTIKCIARKLADNNYDDVILEINASNYKTLEYINTTVAYFCKKKIDTSNKIKHKLIIFDEADNITKKAQNLLANLMEEYSNLVNVSNYTSFAFTCNDSSKIIESIQSRCMIIRYTLIPDHLIIKKLTHICDNEHINYDITGLSAISLLSKGDVRKSINSLETTYYGYNNINKENVYKTCYQPHPEKIKTIINKCALGKLTDSITIINELRSDGYCVNDILLSMLHYLIEMNINKKDEDIEDMRIKFIQIISEQYIIVADGIDSNLQLYNCVCRMIKYILDTS